MSLCNLRRNDTIKPDSDETITILYIAGYGRSGSTLLGRLIARHRFAFDAGEIASLFTTVNNDEQACSCGKTIVDCDFWVNVVQLLEKRLGVGFQNELPNLRKQTEHLSSLPKWMLDRNSAKIKRYSIYLGALYQAISEVSGCSVIIDSSKSSYRAAWRPNILSETHHLRVVPCLLIRRLPAVYYSVRRGSNRKLESGLRKHQQTLPFLRVVAGWCFANIIGIWTICRFKQGGAFVVRYENIEKDVLDMLELCDLGEEHEVQKNAIAHSFGGNRMRHKAKLTVAPDIEWAQKLGFFTRCLFSPFEFGVNMIIRLTGITKQKECT